jgi:hypothetical protein
MVFASNYERIQQRLHAEATTGPFYAIITDVETKLQTVDDSAAIPPASVIAEEFTMSFGTPSLNRRTNRSERQSWRWRVACRFNQDVTIEAAEKRLIATNIILPRDSVNDLEQVTLKLLDSDPFHPPQQSPTSGTQVTFTFEAELSPV